MPNILTSRLAAPFKTVIAGLNMLLKIASGPASQRAVCSGLAIATDFGASSPITMCRTVMIVKAIATEMTTDVASPKMSPSQGSIK